MGSKKYKNKECAYCGNPSDDADHIPPKNLFAPTNRAGIIKIPVCHSCHSRLSLDDEYFGRILAMREDTFYHPDVQVILPTVLEAFSMPEKRKYRDATASGIQMSDYITPFDIWVPAGPSGAPTYVEDVPRMCKVVERITTGLYYHERGVRLPDSHMAVAHYERDIMRDMSFRGGKLRSLRGYALARPPKTIGSSVFTYWFTFFDNYEDKPEHISLWLLQFYGRVSYLCMTYEKEDIQSIPLLGL